MRVVSLEIVKDDRDHRRIFCHHVISSIEVVIISGNVFQFSDEFSECVVEELGLFPFRWFLLLFVGRFGIGTFLYFSFKLHVWQ